MIPAIQLLAAAGSADNLQSRCGTDALEQIRSSSIRVQVAAALDDWAAARRRTVADQEDDASWKRLVMAAGAIDPDPWRDRLRNAWSEGQTETLLELAESAAVAELPPATVSLLAVALVNANRHEVAHSLLRKGHRVYPGDFWVNYSLAEVASELRITHESVRYATVAVALRPDNPAVHGRLASSLLKHGEVAEAIAAFRDVHPGPTDRLAARPRRNFRP